MQGSTVSGISSPILKNLGTHVKFDLHIFLISEVNTFLGILKAVSFKGTSLIQLIKYPAINVV